MTSLEEWRLSGVVRSSKQDDQSPPDTARSTEILTGAPAFRLLANDAASNVLRYQGEMYVLAPEGIELPDGVLGIAFHLSALPNGLAVIGSAQPLALLRSVVTDAVGAGLAPADPVLSPVPPIVSPAANERRQMQELVTLLATPIESLGARLDRLDFLRAAHAAAQSVPDTAHRERLMQSLLSDATSPQDLSTPVVMRVLAMTDEAWHILAGLLRSVA